MALAGGCLSALVALSRVAFSFATIGISGQLNDFYAYWAAGVLLNRGGNPYDVAALAAVQNGAGVYVETGSGFSYPLFFAHLMRPLALLPPATAAVIFSTLSLVALAFAVAASANLPTLLYSLFWRRFNTSGALWSIYGGLISTVVLIVFSPVVSGKPVDATGKSPSMLQGVDFHWFPLDNPGIVSIPLSFLLGYLGTLLSSEVSDEAKFITGITWPLDAGFAVR